MRVTEYFDCHQSVPALRMPAPPPVDRMKREGTRPQQQRAKPEEANGGDTLSLLLASTRKSRDPASQLNLELN